MPKLRKGLRCRFQIAYLQYLFKGNPALRDWPVAFLGIEKVDEILEGQIRSMCGKTVTQPVGQFLTGYFHTGEDERGARVRGESQIVFVPA